jgi:putative nucleotidyltransferase with HDIG domain
MICPDCEATNEAAAQTCYRCAATLRTTLGKGSIVASRYEILSALGSGGMGTVYKAHDRVLDEAVALKVLRPEIALDPDMARRFQLEIKLARKVTHKNVCRLHEYGEDGGTRYLSMEFVAGTNLRQVVQAQGGLLAEGALTVALEIAAGLQAIHDVGVVHRDLKTLNIMLDSRGVVRLLDFGIAKEWTGRERNTSTGIVVGTPEYMSPEQARGERVDFRSDIYALGILVYELFTGQVPFSAPTAMATLYKQVHEEPALAGEAALQIPAPLVPVLRRALAKDPAARYASVREFADALRRVEAELFPPLAGKAPVPAEPLATAGARPASAIAASDAERLLRAIGALGDAVRQDASLDRLLNVLADSARELLGAAAARVLLFDSTPADAIVIEAGAGALGDELRGTALARGEGIAALVAETQQAVRNAGAAEHPRYSVRCDELRAGPGFVCVPLRCGARRGALLAAGRVPDGFVAGDLELLRELAASAGLAIDGVAARERVLDAFAHASELLVSFLEGRDVRLEGHSRNVAALADMLAARLGMSETEQLQLHFAALLHDVGKLRVDPAALNAEAPLSDAQRALLHEHVALGVQLLAPLAPWPELLQMIQAHHERWDGKGYPRGLEAAAIPLGARIIAVADVFDAITSRGVGPAQARVAIKAFAGSQFDPQVVQAFLAAHEEQLARLGL